MGRMSDSFNNIGHCPRVNCGAGGGEDGCIVVCCKRCWTRKTVPISEVFHVVGPDVEDGVRVGEGAVRNVSVER